MRILYQLACVPLMAGVLLCGVSSVQADNSGPALLHRSLDELMEMEVEVASKTSQSIREAPGVVTVMTRDEIENSGARDFVELLRRIPGVQFGIDVQGNIGVGIRGLWGNEGKVLLLWNGHEMNEQLYATIQLANRFPIDEIERIEMIRGPGSVLYGGFAELAVINVITRDAGSLNGGYVVAGAARTDVALSQQQLGVALGKEIDDFRLKASAFWGEALQGDGQYRDAYGSSYSLKEDSQQRPQMFSLDGGYGNFDIKLLADRYSVRQRDQYAEALPEEISLSFDSYRALMQYHTSPSEALTVSGKMAYKIEYPWQEKALPSGENEDFDTSVERYSAQLTAHYTINEVWAALLGADYSWDHARDRLGEEFSNGESSISFWDVAPFFEGEGRFAWANVRAGIRIDEHEEFGTNTVPRVSLTKEFDRTHFKFLASKAYRAPAISNIERNAEARANGYAIDEIEPEETTVYEIESGYKFSDSLHATINLFHTVIDDPIVYFVDDQSKQEGYANVDQAGTQGVEISSKWINPWGYVDSSYSYYQRIDGDAKTYEVPEHKDDFLAFARHKFATHAHYALSDQLGLNGSLIVLGERFGYTSVDEQGEPELRRFDPLFLLNASVAYRPPAAEHLKFSIGIANLLNEDFEYIQPYDNDHAPIGSLGREYWLRAVYRF